MTHYVLSAIAVAHPRVSHRIWIDGLSQGTSGSRSAVRRQLASCTIETCQELQAKQLAVSPKSVVIWPHFQDAKWIAAR
eukprot:8050078-Pyramimonas_sp.AAC.1